MKISVVIPTYKRPDLLNRLLISIRKQSLQPQEVVVVDDCSGMSQEYNACIEKFLDEQFAVKYICLEKNSGAPKARNTGILAAKNDWIALVDDDDEWMPQKLEKQACLVDASKNERLGLVYTWTHAKGEKGQESYDSCISVKGNGRQALLKTNFIMSASVLVKKKAIIEAGLFDLRLPSCQDWDMWTKIALTGYELDVVEEILTIYHRHGGESIGLSPRAKLGYRMFLEAHKWQILKNTGPLNWIKKFWLYINVWRATQGVK
ncbi:MAG: glycosyltransferase family 2 protein [Gammaproteobacteria bacterium]|nr:MAG: glycosyltransferase family 2 protein [Gammaproteobacteria bacterium]